MSTYKRDILTLYNWATVFGVISPNIRISRVSIPVEIPTAALPNTLVVRVVARDDAEMFTMLFPIKMVLISFALFSVTLRTLAARLLPESAIERRAYLFTVVSAVSADEKKADRRIRMTSIISCIIPLGSMY
ncbi:uncharacterized protein BN781_01370 [Coprococcus sp. CAG:782]|nr:uncharacterized protein BN781_01370 [Coprococcus sp. CAG:782]